MRSMPALCRAADRKVLFAIQRHCRCHAGDRIFPYVTAWETAVRSGGLPEAVSAALNPPEKPGSTSFRRFFSPSS